MGLLSGRDTSLDPMLYPRQAEGEPSWIEKLDAVFDAGKFTTNSDSINTVLNNQWGPILELIQERDNIQLENPSFYANFKDAQGEPTEFGLYNPKADKVVNYVQQNAERYPELAWLTKDEVMNRAKNQALESQRHLQKLQARTPGGIGFGTELLGGFGAAATDPINQMSVLLGWGGARSLGGLVLRESIIGATSEAIIQKPVSEWYDSLGLEYTWKDFALAVSSAAAFSAATPLVLTIGGKTISLGYDQVKRGLTAFRDAGLFKKGSPENTLVEQLDREAMEANDSPIVDINEHNARVEQAKSAVELGEVPPMSAKPNSEIKRPASVNDANNLDGVVFRFDPNELVVDAKTFQFKEGGDEFGVTERLQGEIEWDPVQANEIIVYEKADGSRFIVDGHQRLALAKRIMAQDPSQKINLYGHLFREVDGITTDFARTSAAIKNLKEGTGTAIDAAKVIKADPENVPYLAPQSALVRQAKGLVQLDDEVFGAVINDVIPANYAAIIGQVMPGDKAMQQAAMKVLKQVDPRNEFEAEAIVRQVKSVGVEERTQVDLFGEEVVAESFYLERARILDRALKQLRKDKASFNNLLKNAERIQGEGNILSDQANRRRVQDDSQTIALLQAAANTKGGISDALTEAARLAKESGSYEEPVRNFLDAVRRGIAEGDLDRISAGDAGGFINAPTQGRPRQDVTERAVDGFDDPVNGPEFRRQSDQLEEDLFGTGAETTQKEPDLLADLQKLLNQNADEATIDAHPAVTKAIDDAMAIPRTDLAEGYGTPEWINNREFTFGGDKVVGYSEAVLRLYDDATKLGWTDASPKLPVPDVPVRAERKAVIILGPPAAGKSTFANPIARKLGAAILDADEAKKGLPEYQGGIGANAVHEESSVIAGALEEYATGLGTNIVLPKVGGNPDSIRRLIKRLKDRGYEVDLMDMKVSYENARKRMFERFISTGRLVPPEYLRAVGDNPSKTYDILKKEGAADGYTRVDNNVEKDAAKPIIDDTRGILEGVDLRAASGRGPGGEDGARAIDTRPGEEFVEEVPTELDPDLNIPIDFVPGEGRKLEVQTQSIREIREEFAQDDAMLKRLEDCVK